MGNQIDRMGDSEVDLFSTQASDLPYDSVIIYTWNINDPRPFKIVNLSECPDFPLSFIRGSMSELDRTKQLEIKGVCDKFKTSVFCKIEEGKLRMCLKFLFFINLGIKCQEPLRQQGNDISGCSIINTIPKLVGGQVPVLML